MVIFHSNTVSNSWWLYHYTKVVVISDRFIRALHAPRTLKCWQLLNASIAPTRSTLGGCRASACSPRWRSRGRPRSRLSALWWLASIRPCRLLRPASIANRPSAPSASLPAASPLSRQAGGKKSMDKGRLWKAGTITDLRCEFAVKENIRGLKIGGGVGGV